MTPERWRQITGVFHAALTRDEAGRGAFLASACGEDTALRREVESMLAAHQDASAFGEAATFPQPAPSLEPGSSIGPYRVEHWLGAGGMGQVYKARDTRLGRTVALKILAPELATDPDFRSRFEREARTISQLEHHHICALYDVGDQDGIAYLVMQHLEGETLAQRLDRGALPIEAALTTAKQIADALDGAHSAGVTHRDLKPANIFLTKSGVKLLDFGLAKSKTSIATDGANTAVRKTATTMPGVVLGTVPYMAPEQLEGQEADARTDLFALGSVIYEMVTGRRAFEGEHQANVISSIMSTNPPPMSTLRTGVPAAFDRVVAACLAKDPEARWQSARDVKRALAWILEPASGPGAVVPTRARWRRDAALAAAALLIGAAIASFVSRPFTVSQDAADAPAFRFEVFPPENASFGLSPAVMAISPDGRSLAFHANRETVSAIWVRSLDSSTARMLPGTEHGVQPFWSADGRFLAFSADDKLKKIDASGGVAQLVASSGSQSGAWNKDGVILRKLGAFGHLSRLPSSGGAETAATALDRSRGEISHNWPQFLPDGRHFLYHALTTQREYDGMLYVGALDSPNVVPLVRSDSHAVYAPPGYLFYLRSNTLVAHSFDPSTFRLTGEPVPIVEKVDYNNVSRRGAFAVSNTGTLVYRSPAETQLVWFDRTGRDLESIAPPARYANPALSPDEQRVAVDRVDPDTGTTDIWLIELKRGGRSRLTHHPAQDQIPLWSPDGQRIVFTSNRSGSSSIYQKAASGAGKDEMLLEEASVPGEGGPQSWTRDGRFLIFLGPLKADQRTTTALWQLPLFGDRTPSPFLQSQAGVRQGQLSPDGRWIAYASRESEKLEVYVEEARSGEHRLQISTNGGIEPRWRGDGKELFYLGLDQSLMSVAVTTTSRIEATQPTRLFGTRMVPFPGTNTRNQYVVTADGQRFLINQPPQGTNSSPISVVVNWMDALKKNQP